MKKIFFTLSIIIVSTLFFYSCKTGGSGQAYNLKMRLNIGDTFIQDMQMNMQTAMAVMQTKMKMQILTSFEVISNDSTNKELKLTYNKLNTSMDMGNSSGINTDSLMNKWNNVMLGKSIFIKLSNNNEIVDVSGFDELINSQPDSMGREVMKKMFSKDALNSTFGLMFKMYPKNPVKVGDSWEGDSKYSMMGLNMKIANKYTLLSVKNGMAEVGIDGKLGGNGEMMIPNSGMKMNMDGTQKGTILIRMDNGYLHSASYKMDTKAEMQMMGTKMPMTMKADYTIKGI